MDYSRLCEVYSHLEKTTKRLEKTEILAEFLKHAQVEFEQIICLVQGTVFPPWDDRKIGMSSQLIIKVISLATGTSINGVVKELKRTGDLGLVAELLIREKKQKTLRKEILTVKKVFENLRKLPELTGEGAVARKVGLVAELLSFAEPREARFIIRTVLETMRVGIAEGIVRDAIARAFDVNAKDVEGAFSLLADYAEVAKLAKEKKLNEARIKIGTPIKVMLAIRVESIKEGFEAIGKPAIFEYKLDGFRVQIHKKGDKVALFTRRMENVTKQFPEVPLLIKKYIKGESFIIDSEIVGYNKKTYTYLPFQNISQRIKRKYDIERLVKEFPVEINIFDIVYYEGKNLLDVPLIKRRKLLEGIVTHLPWQIRLTKRLITSNEREAEKFYKESLKHGNEGIMIKNPNAIYIPGRRVEGWVKLKPIMETLDLTITGAIWGEGKRATWLGSFVVACRKDHEFLEVGKVGTGIKEKDNDVTFEALTKELKPYIIEHKGKEVKIKPYLVLEIAYEEIQKSPTYSSGFALRFPRVVRIRYDRSAGECDDIARVVELYNKQKRKEK